MSSPLRGRPAAFPSAISRAQTRPAFSSNDRTRPANSACGPSGPANQFRGCCASCPRLLQDASADFGDRKRGDEQIVVLLRAHPSQQRIRRLRLYDVADDIGIKKVACHRSTLRPSSRGRLRSRSAPTRGERRNAARIPPAFGGSPATACCMVRRSCPASGPSSVNFRARDRSRLRSASSAWISNRAMPRSRQARSIILDGSLLRTVAHRLPPCYIWIYSHVFRGAQGW